MRRLKRTLAIVALLIIAINANAWPWISPYAYCMGNPIRFIDPDGRDVHPADNNAFVMLLNTISPEDREFIVLNRNGNIDYATMLSHKSESQNYAALMDLVSSDLTYNIYAQTEYSYIDNAGNANNDQLSYSAPDIEFADPEFLSPSGLTTGEAGKYGITLLPGQGMSGVNSPNQDVHTYIHPFLSPIGQAEALSHELYTPIRDKIAISCMLREIHEFSSHAIRHGLYIKNRKRFFCP